VQAFPSSQAPDRLTKTQPSAGSQESVVQALPSSQPTDVPAQAPWLQASLAVHAFPSSQAPGTGRWTHVPPASHASEVQTLPSEGQAAPSGAVAVPQPLAGAQLGTLHAAAGQVTAVPPAHAPAPSQASPSVQASPSSHGAPAAASVNAQPDPGSHETAA
jgi:hypothetical protein